MRSLKLIAVLVPLLLLVGCAKRTAKKPAADDPPSGQSQQSAATTGANKKGDPNAKGEDPNWLNDPRFKTDPAYTPLPGEAPPSGKPGWGVGSGPKDGWTAPPKDGKEPTPAPGPMGVTPAVPGTPVPAVITTPMPPKSEPAAPVTTGSTKYSTVTEADMKEVWIFIENFSGANSGKMPSKELIFKALIAADSKAAPLVKDGSIYLTGSTTRESVWAFEMKALTSGGLVCSQNGVETLTAAELKKRLGK